MEGNTVTRDVSVADRKGQTRCYTRSVTVDGSKTGNSNNCQDTVPIAIVVFLWARHLAAIPIEAGRLSHTFMPLRPNGTYFWQTL